jgi:hypothetical protein
MVGPGSLMRLVASPMVNAMSQSRAKRTSSFYWSSVHSPESLCPIVNPGQERQGLTPEAKVNTGSRCRETRLARVGPTTPKQVDLQADSVDPTDVRLRNDAAHLPGPLRVLDDGRDRRAAPVRCSDWLGSSIFFIGRVPLISFSSCGDEFHGRNCVPETPARAITTRASARALLLPSKCQRA